MTNKNLNTIEAQIENVTQGLYGRIKLRKNAPTSFGNAIIHSKSYK